MKTMSMNNLISEVQTMTDEQFDRGQLNATLMRKIHEMCDLTKKLFEQTPKKQNTMRRLTRKDKLGCWCIPEFGEVLPAYWQACNHLARFENIVFKALPDETYEERISLERLSQLVDDNERSQLLQMPVPQFTTVYYIIDGRVYTGWYLAKVGESSHLILQDRIEMGICWATDGYWFTDEEKANAALLKMQAASAESEKH